jgi:hypothetical protein
MATTTSASTASKKKSSASYDDGELSTLAAATSMELGAEADLPEPPPESYTPADLRPGKLLLLEFSRPGGSTKEDDEADLDLDDGKKKKKRKKMPTSPPLARIEKMTTKIVNMAYAKMLAHFAWTPWGLFVTDSEVESAFDVLEPLRQCAVFTNRFAIQMKSPRRVRLDMWPIKWDHNDPRYRLRMGEAIAERLIELREAYTSKIMWTYRVRMDKCKHLGRLVTDAQAEVIRHALQATAAQRKVMIAIYGDKCPLDWTDPRTGRLKDSIRLDFTEIDRAIRYFCPSWRPPEGATTEAQPSNGKARKSREA